MRDWPESGEAAAAAGRADKRQQASRQQKTMEDEQYVVERYETTE